MAEIHFLLLVIIDKENVSFLLIYKVSSSTFFKATFSFVKKNLSQWRIHLSLIVSHKHPTWNRRVIKWSLLFTHQILRIEIKQRKQVKLDKRSYHWSRRWILGLVKVNIIGMLIWISFKMRMHCQSWLYTSKESHFTTRADLWIFE